MEPTGNWNPLFENCQREFIAAKNLFNLNYGTDRTDQIVIH